MNSKSILTSKTFWFNVLTILATLVPPIRAVLPDTEVIMQLLGGVNILLRIVTSQRVTLRSDNNGDTGGQAGAGGVVPLVLAPFLLLGAVGLGFFLPSCSPVSQPAVNGVAPVSYGIQYTPGRGWAIQLDPAAPAPVIESSAK